LLISHSIGDNLKLTFDGSSTAYLLPRTLLPAAVQALPVHHSLILPGSYAGHLFLIARRVVSDVRYSARVTRTIAVASAYSDVIKYIEANIPDFDPVLADAAINELRHRFHRRLQ
jgi:hypothetical protein